MSDKEHVIIDVVAMSIAEEVGIEAGDILVSISGQEVIDALDYHLMAQEEEILLTIRKKETNEVWEIEIEKEEDEELGLVFQNNLMDEYQSCRNKCVFCFIDQLPPNMRETLYFKDDDARLSFLQGNYITLTNMTEREVARIIKYHLSPINLSIHTMNMTLRKTMLKNRFADKLIPYMDRLFEAHITMNGQIVLCKGLNDQEELAFSIEKMIAYLPHLQSVSIVPVGLSKHREGLYPLEPFEKEDAKAVIELIDKWQVDCKEKHQTHFIHAADEFYFLAGVSVPEEVTYDNYLQLENGVGSTRLFIETVKEHQEKLKPHSQSRRCTLVTGMLMGELLKQIVNGFKMICPGVDAQVVPIVNHFFGERITVSGLLTGQDIVEQLRGLDLGTCLYLPNNVLKSGESVLLDDYSLKDIEEQLGIEVKMLDQYGEDFVEEIYEHRRSTK